jgi:hypothetical protein
MGGCQQQCTARRTCSILPPGDSLYEATLDKITKHLDELEVELPWILKAYRDRRAGLPTAEPAALAAAEAKGRRSALADVWIMRRTLGLEAFDDWLRRKARGE